MIRYLLYTIFYAKTHVFEDLYIWISVRLKNSQNSQEYTCAPGVRPETVFKKRLLLHLFYHYYVLKHIKECVPQTISYHLYILRITKVWSLSHHGSVVRVYGKECCFIFTYTILAFFCCFLSKKICFYHFYFFFHEVSQSNFYDRILTNHTPE